MDRAKNIACLHTEIFDVCIIGGGATGAGCALDAALRGLKVVLIEKEDFAAATSSKSTKLIHGGVRYLEQAVKKLSWAQFAMVRKALKERRTLLKIAPHLTHPLALLTPCFTWVEGWYYAIGLKMYDWISGTTNIGNSKWLSKALALKRLPTLRKEKLASAVLYWDGQLNDLRFAMALVQTAAKHGAIVINHFSADVFEKDTQGKLCGLHTIDSLTGEKHFIKAKQYINATGPFADAIREKANANLHPRIRVSKGVHITLPTTVMPGETAMLIPKTEDGRLIFVIPYQGQLLVGTTDDETQLTNQEFGPNSDEIDYLLSYVNKYLHVNLTKQDVTSGFGGLRPLLQAANTAGTKELVRDHEVEVDEASGLISILGGKWTTYRLMAKDTIDTAEKLVMGNISLCKTENEVLSGGENFDYPTLSKTLLIFPEQQDVVDHLLHTYGTNAKLIIGEAKEKTNQLTRLLPEAAFTYEELSYVMEKEMAYTVKDVIARRWGIALTNWKQTIKLIPLVGEKMASHFNWSATQRVLYIDAYKTEVLAMMKNAGITT